MIGTEVAVCCFDDMLLSTTALISYCCKVSDLTKHKIGSKQFINHTWKIIKPTMSKLIWQTSFMQFQALCIFHEEFAICIK